MISDLQARAQAIEPNQSFIVQAPAGSGKTELLTQRILSLLAFNAKTPESILAITFTRKAAHEMRLRVIKSLHAGLDPDKPQTAHQEKTWELARRVLEQDKNLGWDLLKNPQRLQIMTIDAFCASLVKQLPIESQMGGMAQICQEPDNIYLETAKITLNDLLHNDDQQVQDLLLHLDNQQQKAVELIANMLARREQWLPLIMRFHKDEELRFLLEENLQNITESMLKNIASHWTPDLWKRLAPLLEYSRNHREHHETWSLPLSWESDNLSAWKDLHEFIFTRTGTVRKTVDKRNGFPPADPGKNKEAMKEWLADFESNKACVKICESIPLLPSAEYTDEQWKILIALLHVLPQACAQLMVRMQARDEIDFSGVAQAALVALGDEDSPTALTLKLDYQLQHILIDEFQDTSLLQYALLEKLVAGWLPDEGRTLFLVGDPMQSIYRFRQAEVGLFLRVQEFGLGQIPVQNLHLSANFRSDPAIIDWINQQAPEIFSSKDDLSLGAIRYSPSQAARESTAGAGVHLHSDKDLLGCLEELLKNEKLSSIAILVRARSHLKEILPQLKAAGLPYQAVELEHLADQALVQDLLSLTRALNHLADSVAWLALLRSPPCGFSLSDITLIREQDIDACVWENLSSIALEKLSLEGQRIWQRIHPVLAQSLAQRCSVSLCQSVEETWFALGGPACLTEVEDLTLAEKFFSILEKSEQGGRVPDLSDLNRRLKNARLTQHAGETRVQVMTLHKAKGLEFDAVLLPQLHRPPNHSEKSLLIWEQLPTEQGGSLLIAPIQAQHGEASPLYQFLSYRTKQKDDYEVGRLLYVGMTRAKQSLHLFATKVPAKGSLLSLLWPLLEEEFIGLLEPEDEQPEKQMTQNLSTRLSTDWRWPQKLVSPINLFTELPEGDNRVSIDEFSYEANVAREQGVLLHRVLCKMALQGLETWEKLDLRSLRPAFKAQLRELGIHRGLEGVLDTLTEALKKVLNDSKGRWILSPHTQHEAEAVYGSCIIDRTFIDEEGVRWIIDYKTSAEINPDSLETYRRQLAKYAQIFKAKGEKNIRCALYYPLFSGWLELS